MSRKKRFWFAIIAILPTFAIFGWVRMFPIAETLRLSLFEWNLLSRNKPFVGLENFREPRWRSILLPLAHHHSDQPEVINAI